MLARLTLLAATFVCATPALAQNAGMTPEVGGELSLGVGGQIDANVVGFSTSAKLDPTPGLALRASLPLHEYFALDARIGVHSWAVQDDDQRHALWDFGLVPRVRLAPSETLEVYLGVPVGLTISKLSDNSDGNTALGVHIGALSGAHVRLNQKLALMFELGYLVHGAEHDLGLLTVDARIGQVMTSAGILVRI